MQLGLVGSAHAGPVAPTSRAPTTIIRRISCRTNIEIAWLEKFTGP